MIEIALCFIAGVVVASILWPRKKTNPDAWLSPEERAKSY